MVLYTLMSLCWQNMMLDCSIASAGSICQASMLGLGEVCAITTCYRTRQYSKMDMDATQILKSMEP